MRLPEGWEHVMAWIRHEHGEPLAWLLHGSRAPGWPEGPLESSDYDVVAVTREDPAGGRVRVKGRVRGVGRIDAVLVGRRGVRASQVLSPEWHVMTRYGTRLGDWSWYDPGVPLAWAAADDAADSIRLRYELAVELADDDPHMACRVSVLALRSVAILMAAVGKSTIPPTWSSIVVRHHLPDGLIRSIRTHDLSWECNREDAELLLAALCAEVGAVSEVIRQYPRNASDEWLLASVAHA